MVRRISLFGATGTIGDNALDLMARHADAFDLVAVSANRNIEKLVSIVEAFSPELVVTGDEAGREAFMQRLPDFSGHVLCGEDGLKQMAGAKTDVAIIGIVGFAGLMPSLECAKKRWLFGVGE